MPQGITCSGWSESRNRSEYTLCPVKAEQTPTMVYSLGGPKKVNRSGRPCQSSRCLDSCLVCAWCGRPLSDNMYRIHSCPGKLSIESGHRADVSNCRACQGLLIVSRLLLATVAPRNSAALSIRGYPCASAVRRFVHACAQHIHRAKCREEKVSPCGVVACSEQTVYHLTVQQVA